VGTGLSFFLSEAALEQDSNTTAVKRRKNIFFISESRMILL
jgi:hypothetical protein